MSDKLDAIISEAVMSNIPKGSVVTFWFHKNYPNCSFPVCHTKDGEHYEPEFFTKVFSSHIINEFAPKHELTGAQGSDFLRYLCEQGESTEVKVPGKWFKETVLGKVVKIPFDNLDEELAKHIPNFRATEKQRAVQREEQSRRDNYNPVSFG